MHLSGKQAGSAAATAGARRLLTHYAPWVDQQELANEAANAFGDTVEVVRPGTTYTI